MNYAVYGKSVYSLSNKNTKVYLAGNTYRYSDDKKTSPLEYRVSLHIKNAVLYCYRTVGKANGSNKSINYGKLPKDKYKVSLVVKNSDPSGCVYRYIKGAGSVYQN